MSDAKSFEDAVMEEDRAEAEQRTNEANLDQDVQELGKRMSEMMIDASRVLMMVGDGNTARPMSVPQIFQEMFSILGDIDHRLNKLEKGERPSGLIVPN